MKITAPAVTHAIISIPISVSFVIFPHLALGSSFQSFEQGLISTSLAHADMAAGAYDATTSYYNPAGMTRLDEPQITGGLEGAELVIKSKYHLSGLVVDALDPESIFINNLPDSHANPGGGLAIPNLHGVLPIRLGNWPDMALGLSVVAPFGLETNYDGSSATTYAKQTKIQTITANPNFAMKIFEGFSLGAGLDVQQTKATVTSGVDALNIIAIDAEARASSWDVTWNVGALYEFSDTKRIGITYRPQVNSDLKGHATLNNNIPFLAPGYQKVDTKINLDLPATTSFGYYQDLSDRLAIMVNATYTQWSSIQTVNVVNETPIEFIGLPIDKLSVPFLFENSWFYSVGSNFKINKKWDLRGGFGVDMTPTTDEAREMRIPDATRYIFAAGVGYAWNENLHFDVGGQYLYSNEVDINNPFLFVDLEIIAPIIPDGISTNDLLRYSGTSNAHGYLIGAQASFTF